MFERSGSGRWASTRCVPFIVCAMGLMTASPSGAVTDLAATCAAIKSIDFTGLQDAATQIIGTKMTAAQDELPAHCVVDGYVAPTVGFKIRLPGRTDWNGKFAEVSPGGYGGSAAIDYMEPWCDDLLRRGYACLVQDTGHTGGAGLDATWAYNNLQGEFDYGIRAAHVASIAGKAITQQFYSESPRFSYFLGCSGGGKQALVQAQRYPWNFDGVIAFEPSNPTITGTVQLWNALATHDAEGKPLFTKPDLQVLHDAVMAKCDLNDGIKDGLIGGDPRRCSFDPAALECKAGQTSQCLSPVQVAAAKKVYGGPVTSTGRKLYFPATPGGELGSFFTGGPTGIDYKRTWWQYMGFTPDPGPTWKPTDFDFDHDWKRAYMMDAILVASDNPDLRKLRAEGNKLMVIQGWEDSGLPGPRVTVDYYEMVEKLMGGRAKTQEFFRVFMMPGRSHCQGGVGAAAVDATAAMEAWVEQGRAPDMIVGANIPNNAPRGDFFRLPKDPSSARFTRPHYPYPLQAKYKGKGDPNDYRSFEPVDPERK